MQRTERRTPAGLSRARVLDAALELVDREGIEKLSMRRLGARLGVEAMTLYHYVPSKTALLDGVVERVVAAAAAEMVDAEDAGWSAVLRRFAVSWRAALLHHPGVLPLMATRPVMSTAALDTLEACAARLSRAGFTAHQALHLINLVATFVIGHTLAEAGTTPGHGHADLTAVADLDASRYPTLRVALDDGLGDDHEQRFAYGLDVLITGLTTFGPPAMGARPGAPVSRSRATR